MTTDKELENEIKRLNPCIGDNDNKIKILKSEIKGRKDKEKEMLNILDEWGKTFCIPNSYIELLKQRIKSK